jgi:beta-1,4-mannosyl-glycoprotein beta-1,4-N-acetylglucosaminyltransferase
MILTAQPFFNELDLLEIKCRELAGVVDLHVVVESALTFTGIPKPLYFAENAARFAEFPIHHVVVDLPPALPTDDPHKRPWDREWLTHKARLNAVRRLRPDIAIWCDTDEIPRRDTVGRFRAMNVMTAHVDMDSLCFYFNRIDPTQRPTTAKIGYFDAGADWNPWRGETHHPVIPDAGWHVQYLMFGGRGHLIDKLNATAHAAEDKGEGLRSRLERGEPFDRELARLVPYPIEKLPRFVQDKRGWFAEYFAP